MGSQKQCLAFRLSNCACDLSLTLWIARKIDFLLKTCAQCAVEITQVRLSAYPLVVHSDAHKEALTSFCLPQPASSLSQESGWDAEGLEKQMEK